MLVEMKRHNAC